jgi:phage terminase large subunit
MRWQDYQPREFAKALHNRKGKRWTTLVLHRRAGKTVSCVVDLILGCMETEKSNPSFAYFAPFRSQAKSVAWQYLKELSRDYWAKPPNEAELTVFLKTQHGTVGRIICGGTDNMDALRGNYYDGVVLDEVAQMSPSAWYSIIRPALADRKGWAIFAGTPHGYNLFFSLKEEARLNPKTHLLIEVKASESGILDDDELRDAKIQMTEDAYLREFECSFDASIPGAIWARDIGKAYEENRIYDFSEKIDSEMEVEVVGDLGFTDSCSWWVWQTGPEGYRIIDFYESNSQPISHYIEWIHNLPYKVKTVWLPHDARAKSLQTGRSMIEAFLENGIRPNIVPMMDILDGIEAARQVLPKCYFNEPSTSEGIEHLRGYSREWDDKAQVFKNKPKHDHHSHASDSFRYLSLVAQKIGKVVMPLEVQQGQRELKSYGFSLNDIWDTAPTQNTRIG